MKEENETAIRLLKKVPKRGLTDLEAACVRHLGNYHPTKHHYHSNIAKALAKRGIVLKPLLPSDDDVE